VAISQTPVAERRTAHGTSKAKIHLLEAAAHRFAVPEGSDQGVAAGQPPLIPDLGGE
jgi:hypothetical protein